MSADYTEIFYDTLEHLHSIHPWALEILAFPFDHPDIDIEKCRGAIEKFEKTGGGRIHIMQAVEINGPNTHPIFRYLKKLFDMDAMDSNFSHYFFISPDGNFFELHYGASYNTLKIFVDHHVKTDLGDVHKMTRDEEYKRYRDEELRHSVERRSRTDSREF
jgi:glutathione peroxidase-family protein